MTTKQNIEKVLWSACDSFRGKIDSSRYKDYILSMLFVKYLSDVYSETKENYINKYNGDMRRVKRAMNRERFVMDETSTFTYLYNNRNDTEIGQKINVALASIENNNSAKLHDVFRAIDFNSTVDFGEPREKNDILKNLLEDFKDLDLRPSQLDSVDIIGDSYEYMIANFASDAGKKGGEFYTPNKVSELVARLVQPKENDRIYDATCGSGGLLLKAFKQIPSGKARIYGQEQNMQTWALCRMNLFVYSENNVFFQNISKARLIAKKSVVCFGENFEYKSNQQEIVINDLPDAIYVLSEDRLYFRRLESITSIFKGIDQLYREATDEEVNSFLHNDFISLQNGYGVSNVKTANRKRIALAKKTLDELSDADRRRIFAYIGEYCPGLKTDKDAFEIGTEDEMKMLLFGIEQRFYTTPVGGEKRLASSVIPLQVSVS